LRPWSKEWKKEVTMQRRTGSPEKFMARTTVYRIETDETGSSINFPLAIVNIVEKFQQEKAAQDKKQKSQERKLRNTRRMEATKALRKLE
jgi:hypothetical protein